jgi:hypothetical protein
MGENEANASQMEKRREYMTLEYKGILFQVKFDEEGVVLDIFDEIDGEQECVQSTWRWYRELGNAHFELALIKPPEE